MDGDLFMIDAKVLADKLKCCADGQPLVGFENWFAEESWNVHQQQDQPLMDAVFRIEYLLGSLDEGRIDSRQLRAEFEELAEAIRPFSLAAMHAKPIEVVYGRPSQKTSASRPLVLGPVAVSL